MRDHEERAFDAVRVDFMQSSRPHPSLRALAEEHGVSYAAVLRRARRERWEAFREVCVARRRLAENERREQAARALAIRTAAALLRLARNPRAPLGPLSDRAHATASAAGALWSEARWVLENKKLLRAAERAAARRTP